ncbi:hypothetical protein ACFLXD_04475 [Chloroflexota bacterium]
MKSDKIEAKAMKIKAGINRFAIIIILGFLIIVVGCARGIPVSQTLPPTGPMVVKKSGGAGLLIAECQDRQYIINTADYIVEGIVKRVEINWNEDKSAIITTTYLSTEKYVKGAPFTESELQIVTPGGTVGDITQVVEDQPIFHEGKVVRIYFQKVDGEFHIVCAQFGVEDLGLLNPSPSH